MSPAVEPQLDRLVSSLIAHRVEFVVIGGFAVVAHRFVRATNDSDLLVPDDIENDRRCLAALSALSAVRDSDTDRWIRAKTPAGHRSAVPAARPDAPVSLSDS